MQKNTYTISELSKKFNESKQVIRRRIDSLKIKSINRDTRTFPNEPLEYNFESYKKLADSFGMDLEKNTKNDDTQQHAEIHGNDTQNNTEKIDNGIIIEILERELEHSKEKLNVAEEEKKQLYRLLNQQQQLSLNDQNEIASLELELKNLKRTEIILSSKEEAPKEESKFDHEQTTKKKGFFSRLFNI